MLKDISSVKLQGANFSSIAVYQFSALQTENILRLRLFTVETGLEKVRSQKLFGK